MEILATYSSDNPSRIVFGVIMLVVCVLFLILAFAEGNEGHQFVLRLIGAAALSLAIISFVVKTPTRHEVILRDPVGLNGEKPIIDATKYKIVDQRGKIYVIEERKGATTE